jgi:hypothetical protein
MNLTAEHIRQIERAIANGVPPRIIMYLWGVTRHEIAKIKVGPTTRPANRDRRAP